MLCNGKIAASEISTAAGDYGFLMGGNISSQGGTMSLCVLPLFGHIKNSFMS